jgi:hypothetical protein
MLNDLFSRSIRSNLDFQVCLSRGFSRLHSLLCHPSFVPALRCSLSLSEVTKSLKLPHTASDGNEPHEFANLDIEFHVP